MDLAEGRHCLLRQYRSNIRQASSGKKLALSAPSAIDRSWKTIGEKNSRGGPSRSSKVRNRVNFRAQRGSDWRSDTTRPVGELGPLTPDSVSRMGSDLHRPARYPLIACIRNFAKRPRKSAAMGISLFLEDSIFPAQKNQDSTQRRKKFRAGVKGPTGQCVRGYLHSITMCRYSLPLT
jgi:hypothetical protein